MPVSYPIQTNFTSGEISPSLYGRVDISKYFNAAAIIENFLALPEGGLQKRSGTQFISEVKDSSKLTIQLKFEFSTVQVYDLEIGDQYIRIIKDREVVLSGGVPVEVVTPYLEADLRDLRFAQSADVLFIVHPAYAPRVLTRTSHTSWSLSLLDFRDGPYLAEDSTDTELRLEAITNRGNLNSTSAEFVVGDVGKYVEFVYQGQTLIGLITAYVDANNVTIEPKDNVVDSKTIDTKAVVTYASASGGLPNRLRATTLIWSSEVENSYIKVGSTWYLLGDHLAQNEEIAEVVGPPKEPAYSLDIIRVTSTPTMKSTAGTLVFSDQTITATLKASKATFDSSRDIGRHFRLNLLSEQVWGAVTAYVSTTQVTVELGRMVPLDPKEPGRFLADAKTTKWRFGAWYVDNYPSVVTFHEGRLNFFNTPLEPQTHWASESAGYGADFVILSPTDTDSQVLDTSGITRTLDSGKINAVYWAVTGPVLLIGTQGAEWQIKAESINEALTPGNYNAKEQTAWGSENIPAERIGPSVLFVQRGGRILRELTYSFEIDSHVASFMSILSNHIFKDKGGVVDMAIQRAPYTRIWLVTNSGELVSITFEKEQEVTAFTRHIIGGSYNGGIAQVESVEVVPENENDVVYVVVKRTINGVTKRYVECIEKDFWPTDTVTKDDQRFMDSWKYQSYGTEIPFTKVTPVFLYGYPLVGVGTPTAVYYFQVEFPSPHGFAGGEVIRLTNTGFDFLDGEPLVVYVDDATTITLLDLDYKGAPPLLLPIGGPGVPQYEYNIQGSLTSPNQAGTAAVVENTITGLAHLEGETVQAFAEGSYLDEYVVSGGSISLDSYVMNCLVGLKYTAKLKTLTLESGSESGTSQGKLKRIHALTIRLLHSLGFYHGLDENNLEPYPFRDSIGNMDDSPELFTGDKIMKLSGSYDRIKQYYITSDFPYNLHITALMPQVRTTQ